MLKRNSELWGLLLIASVALLVLGSYVWLSSGVAGLGFPLDDAWIHQTYARNLALRGEWAFIPGQPSAGSTSPLWTVLLVPGYFLGLDPFLWTFFLGWVTLTALAWLCEQFSRQVLPLTETIAARPLRVPWVGLFIVGEWHLAWAAGAGMETCLYAMMILLVFWLLVRRPFRPFWAGVMCGVAVWVRPDGLTLLGPLFFVLALSAGGRKQLLQAGLRASGGFLAVFLPYLLFNFALGGAWWPNTFYAKQAEYSVLQQVAYPERLFQLWVLPLVGAGVVLVVGFFIEVWHSLRNRSWVVGAAVLWWAGYTALYAAALPVSYQHGRYLIPAMPVFFTVGLVGTRRLLDHLKGTPRRRLLRFAYLLLLGCIWEAFFLQGAWAYREDVAIIQTEMLPAARWIAGNTPRDVVIAAHDIGALGYFGERQILDLAGLISPEVIPFIRDEARLAAYLDQRHAAYLVTFPKWYPVLVQRGAAAYVTGGSVAPQAGGENLTVYRWLQP